MTRRPPFFVTTDTRSALRNARHQSPRRRSARPRAEELEQRLVLSGLLVTGSGKGSPAEVSVFDSGTGAPLFQFAPYGTSYQGGVQVAVGDVDGNGSLDIVTAPGAGMPGMVKVFSATNGAELGEFLGRPKNYQGGLSVAVGDVTGEGGAEIVVGTLRGPGMVGVFQGVNGQALGSFRAAVGGGSGVQVALGDLNLDAHDDIVTAPVTGRPWVTIYDGATRHVLSRKLAFSGNPRGGIAIAVGDVDADRRPDVIAAEGTKQGATVRVFSGLSATPMLTDQVAGAQFARGVRVAAIDVGGGRGGDDVALAPAGGGGPGATVIDFSRIRTGLLEGPPTAADLSQAPRVVYQLAGTSGGVFVAASNAVSESTTAFVANAAQNGSTLLPYQRLARFQYNPVTGAPELVPVLPNDPSLVGKDVIVLVHGWAADYSYWVNDVAQNTNPKLPTTLTWWDTDPSQPGYNLAANLEANKQAGTILGPAILSPASNFLLHGYNNLGIEASETGMAQTIADRATKADPKAVVLAYTWIDNSGTSSITNPYLSEAYTVEDGEKLADGLRTVLGSQAAFGGQIQLIGHSHGSKVATVAAVSLTTKNMPNTFAVRQLTTLDSPEDLSDVSSDLWADNFNWYYLQNLNISRTDPNATFVDNYISYLSEPYSNITTPSGNSLGQVLDVKLDSSPFPITDRHSYSAYWYTGSGESALTDGAKVGQLWSPLLPGSQAPPASQSYFTQTWASSSYDPTQQYVLQPGTLSARPYSSYALTFASPTNTPSVVASNSSPTGTGASVALTETANVSQPSYTSAFTTEDGSLSGISFNYAFPANAPEATITVSLDGHLVFVIDSGSVAVNSATDGTRAGVGTLGLPQDFISFGEKHNMTVTLSPGTGVTNAQGSITNLNFFYA